LRSGVLAAHIALPLLADNDYRLKENIAFGINTDIHDPKWRDDVGIIFGDTVLVGNPPKLLANVPLTLSVCK